MQQILRMHGLGNIALLALVLILYRFLVNTIRNSSLYGNYRGGPPYTAAVRPLENGPRFEVGSFLGFCNVCASLQFLHLHVFAFAPFAFCCFSQRSELLLSFA